MLDVDVNNFDRLRIGLASSELIREWSRGEVKKPETINYRTLKPEKDGLFCEKIFGPTKDWECYCGKYKRVRFKGIICERCGVEVTRAKVRRDRMGHIELAAPVSHIWYFKGVPSRLGYLLDIAPKDLEKVLYFASSIITSVNEEDREADLEMLESELEADTAGLEAEKAEENAAVQAERDRMIAVVRGELEPEEGDIIDDETPAEDRVKKLEKEADRDIRDLDEEYEERRELLKETFDAFKKLTVKSLISDETLYRELKMRYGNYFRGGMGAEAVKDLLQQIDLDDLYAELRHQVNEGKGQKRHKALKRLKVVSALKTSGNRPEWMILDAIPVIPPDLRPMVQLDGGRFATSDLNDLYRRVINRNNRLKRLLDLGAPEIIVNNEKRMLQEAVDALFDNGRRGRPVTGPGNRPLKSIADMLKGKQGRFRQNLLGKRVDYSGRSVIVVGPELKLHQCGLPKAMALELFKPFVMKRLVDLEYAQNIKSAKRMVDRAKSAVWDVLDEVIRDHPVLLNRAPTLHRLGIQAFEPVLVEGKAIRIHPLVCTAFNADFDGDQMAVHLPLSAEAQAEARVLMLSTNNIKSPAHGRPLAQPTQDMVIGLYYLTAARDGMPGEGAIFRSFDEAVLAYDSRAVDLQARISARLESDIVEEYDIGEDETGEPSGKYTTRTRKAGERIKTTIGRVTFNRSLPDDFRYINHNMDKKGISRIVEESCDRYTTMEMARVLDELKRLGFHYATRAGVTVSVWDAAIPPNKDELLAKADLEVAAVERQYERGLITSGERHRKIVEIWTRATDEVGDAMAANFDKFNPIYMMAFSGARGNIKQVRQLAAMRGLMTKPVKISEKELALNPYMEIMDRPIRANFREGLSPLEYFVSANGARKGLADTALRTADSGYLTRRLVDVAQDVIVREADCATDEGLSYPIWDSEEERVDHDLVGRFVQVPIAHPRTGEVLKDAGEAFESDAELQRIYDAMKAADSGEPQVTVRTVMTCHSRYGVCQKCYGWDLASSDPVQIGTAVGIIAAQSIGEPGTQLTMRTFHTGGVAGGAITQGLPRVTEIFEARKPTVVYRGSAYGDWVSPIHGIIRAKPSKKVDHAWEVKIIPDVIAEVRLRKDLSADDAEDSLRRLEKSLAKKKNVPWLLEAVRGPKSLVVRIDGGHIIGDDRTGKEKEITPTVATGMLEGLLADVDIEHRTVVYKDDKDASGKRFETQELTQTLSPQEWDEAEMDEGVRVTPGTVLRRGGVKNPHMMLLSQGREAVFKYIVREVQKVYRSQGVDINDKHIEVIARQMTRKVEVQQAGDTDLLPGQVTDRFAFEEENARVTAEGGVAASASPILLGITKASLATDSYLSAASFQETTRVLTDAAIAGKEDQLLGLKENVIIGKLIPAATGMKRYRSVMLTYKGQKAEWTAAAEGPLPEFAPEELRELEAMLPGPQQLDEAALSEEDAAAFFADLHLNEEDEDIDVGGFAGMVFEPEPEPEPAPPVAAEGGLESGAEPEQAEEIGQCCGIRADGTPCSNKAKPGTDYCGVHAKQAEPVE